MKNKKGIAILILGLILVGIGSYFGFEKYDKYLESKNIKRPKSIYTGVYKSETNSLSIIEEDENSIKLSIGEESYVFEKNGDNFDNLELNYSINIEKDKLTLVKNGQDSEFYYKEK